MTVAEPDRAVERGKGAAQPDPPTTLRISSWSLVRGVLLVTAGVVVLGVAMAASTVLWWLAIGAVLAGLFHPAVVFLRRWIPAWAAILIVLMVVLGLVGLVGYRGVAELSAQFDQLRHNAIDAARSIQSSRQFGQVAAEFGLVEKTTQFFDGVPTAMVGAPRAADATTTVQTAASSGSALFAIATFAILMLIFGPRFVQAALAQIDDPVVRRRVGILVTHSYQAAARYAWLMAARALVVGLAGGLLCVALGLETPTALGVAFAALSLIPGLGLVLAVMPIAVYTAISSVWLAVAVFVAAVVVQALEAHWVQGRVSAESVHVGPAATLIAALLGLQLYGLGGLLVGLAVAVFGFAVLARLTDAHDEVFSAVRQLVGEDVVAAAGSTVVAGGSGDRGVDGGP